MKMENKYMNVLEMVRMGDIQEASLLAQILDMEVVAWDMEVV